ncbi:MAG: LPS export ABC transporter periplasmic protein LptC [Chitinophagales bacterium]|nr:LPS export ABC transporter periplasmic protein LptC [Chitinophagales bacterium]
MKQNQLFPFSLILSYLLIFACANDLEEVKKVAQLADVNVELGTEVVIDYTEYGKLRAKLYTPILKRYVAIDQRSEFPNGMHLVIYGENGSIENTLDAKFGTIDDVQHIMTARNNVVVVNIKGDTLSTEELIWSQNEKKIYSNSFVKIRTAKEIILGDTLVADEKFTNYTIKKVRGTVQVKK